MKERIDFGMRNILAMNIARYRKENKLTQEELAKKLGITYQAVSKWETEQSMPDISVLPNLASILNTSVDKLLGYNAFQNDISYYENTYKSTKDYYWGINPSSMCLKIISLIPPDKHLKVLDIGCGEGKDSVFLARCGYDVSAFDLSDTGVEKTKRLADKAQVSLNAFKADINDYRLDEKYDILFSSGVFSYIKPNLRSEILDDYRNHTNKNGINAFNVFVEKPFILPPPEKEDAYLWRSGELLINYYDWFIDDFSEFIFDCNSSGVLHNHAMNVIYARKSGY